MASPFTPQNDTIFTIVGVIILLLVMVLAIVWALHVRRKIGPEADAISQQSSAIQENAKQPGNALNLPPLPTP